MDMIKVRDWFVRHSLIKDFEEGVEVKGSSEEKWAFYSQVQNALLSLPSHISPNAKVSQSAELVGQVVIEAGAQILAGVFIEGPVYIGRDVMVGNNALIRRGSFLSRGSIVGNQCYSTAAVLMLIGVALCYFVARHRYDALVKRHFADLSTLQPEV